MAAPLDAGAIPPFEPLVEQPEAIEPAPQAPAGGEINPSEREEWCRRAASACTEGRLTLGAYSDLVGVLQESGERAAFDEAVERVRAAGASAAMVPVVSGPPMVAVLGGHNLRGSVQLGQRAQALAVMGGVDLDLREATVSGPVTVLQGFALMGGVEIRVPPGIRVENRCLPILGGCDVKLRGRPPRPDAPVIRLELVLVMAGVTARDGGGMNDLVRQGATLAAAGFTGPQLAGLQQARLGPRAAARAAHRARRDAIRAARRERRDRRL